MIRERLNRSQAVLLMILTVALTLSFPVMGTRASSAESDSTDGGWPRFFEMANGDSVLIYQPQVSSWDNQEQMVAWSARSCSPASGPVVWIRPPPSTRDATP